MRQRNINFRQSNSERSAESSYSNFKKLDQNNKERIINFNIKTAFGCAEALLTFSRKFAPSYKGRANIFEKTYKKDFPELAGKIPGLAKLIKKYTSLKLRPDYNSINDPVKDWFLLRDYSTHVVKFLLYKFTKVKSDSVEELTKNLYSIYRKEYLKNYLAVKFKIKNYYLLSVLVFPSNSQPVIHKKNF